MPSTKKTSTRKIKNLKEVIQKIKNSMKNDWAVNKTLKKKRNQIGKQMLAQKEKELKNLMNKKKLDFANESNVRFFSDEVLENAKESTAKEMKEKEGRYVSAKARTRKLIKNEKNMKNYLSKMAMKGARTRAILEARWRAQNEYEEARRAFNEYVKKQQKQKL